MKTMNDVFGSAPLRFPATMPDEQCLYINKAVQAYDADQEELIKLRALAAQALKYIEKEELWNEAELGLGRDLTDLIAMGMMPELYTELKLLIKE
jgi:hypothetical protein